MTNGIEILPIEVATFRFAADEPHAGEPGVVVAHAIRHRGGVLLFDTGFGFGNAELDARYQVRARAIEEALADVGIAMSDVTAVANCHLHVDHAGQNARFPGIPIYVQTAEWEVAHTTDHTILEWIDFPDADYRQVDGDAVIDAGIRIVATPGHTPGHQSLVVDGQDGPVVLAGQAIYTAGEWAGDPDALEGHSRAPDPGVYDDSVARLRALEPDVVHFAHDRTAVSFKGRARRGTSGAL